VPLGVGRAKLSYDSNKYSQISLVRYRLFGRAYRNTNGIVISRVTC